MKKALLIIFVLLIAASMGYSQITTKTLDKRHHAFSGTLLFGAEAGVTIGFTDYSQIHPQIIGRGLLEYFFPTTSSGIFGLRGFYSAGYVGGKDDNRDPQQFRATMTSIGGGITYNFSIADAVFPYIFLGASYSWVNPQDNTGFELPYNQNKTASARDFSIESETYIAEVGMRFLLSRDIALNASVGDHFSRNDNWDAVPQGGSNDMMLAFMLGFSYSLFSDYDSDGDGVPDSKDQCPNTPAGVKVDEFGCPIDSDNDGVPDYLDKCPKTPSGVTVDRDGCPLDADGDGVPDYLDKCPNTPKGAPVNERGCPDSDGDGVFDDIDECPDTPKGAPVDAKGCPKDTDDDGVPDYLDECPNTPRGTEVDSKGCPIVDTVVTEITLSGDTNFEFNKSTLLPSAYGQLNPLAESMKKNPNTRWRIEGHTDAIGSDSYNMELSRQRAESVANYLVQQGVERNRLEIAPLGESQPKATNDTQEGRAMNRRVEIKLIK